MSAAVAHLRHALGGLRSDFSQPDLRRIQLAAAVSVVGQWAFSVALAVYAYGEGGATAVAVVTLLRTVPPALAAPFTAVLADRFPRVRVMVVSDLLRAGLLALAAAIAFGDAAPAAVYLLAAAAAVASKTFKPAKAALLPALARTPAELTAANVAGSTIETIAMFAGPAIGGLLVAVTSTGVVFAAAAATAAASALVVARVRDPGRLEPAGARRIDHRAALGGFAAIGAERPLRSFVALYTAMSLLVGAMSVLVVMLALEHLRRGAAGVGFLNAAEGLGGLVGACVALALAGRPRLAGGFGAGAVAWGLALVAIALQPSLHAALVVLALAGAAHVVVDVAATTLLQRAVDDEVLARVFGVLQGLLVAGLGIGATLAPPLARGLGIPGAFAAVGALMPVLAAVGWPRLAALDRAAIALGREVELLRAVPMLAPLPTQAIEALARALEPMRVGAGATVVRQGEPGERWFVIAEGEAEVAVDGTPCARLRRGDGFGEIALLRRVPRTATVTAATDLVLYGLAREPFLRAVCGFEPAREAAESLADARLAGAA